MNGRGGIGKPLPMVWITETLPRQARDLPWLLIGKSFGEIFLDGLYSGSACLCFSRRSQLCHKGFRSPTSLQRTANCRIRRCLKKRFTPSTHKQQGSTGVEPYSVILSIKNTYFNQNAVLEHNPHKKGACSMPAPNEFDANFRPRWASLCLSLPVSAWLSSQPLPCPSWRTLA